MNTGTNIPWTLPATTDRGIFLSGDLDADRDASLGLCVIGESKLSMLSRQTVGASNADRVEQDITVWKDMAARYRVGDEYPQSPITISNE